MSFESWEITKLVDQEIARLEQLYGAAGSPPLAERIGFSIATLKTWRDKFAFVHVERVVHFDPDGKAIAVMGTHQRIGHGSCRYVSLPYHTDPYYQNQDGHGKLLITVEGKTYDQIVEESQNYGKPRPDPK